MSGAFQEVVAFLRSAPWISRFEHHHVDLASLEKVRRCYETVARRSAVASGYNGPDASVAVPCLNFAGLEIL